MDQAWEKVKEFHRCFGVPHKEKPEKLAMERVQKRAKWMEEEIGEFKQARTIEEQADAMIDTIYLALGTLVEMGVRPQALFDIVHTANMDKLWEDGKPRYRESDGKVIKPSSWQDPGPLLREEINRQTDTHE
ncbi:MULTISPECIES: haloacid dehalogenase [Thermoactinomyces]|jgi:predicted HAD superfamily Cof-like phosphohydrolase|uniref:HAD family hydrolase n=1 Tax=Thermoactinomyces daqus TaxID=1329516 RepID=A0A7W2AJA9_9BACL|nr:MULTISPECIES: haloacid dehalogenase [Thermoactinomyces]MBA4543584.1 HAD family hydrolase [Thermoactinomyces daqus]MBH8596554.1 HAD family hydrolase [Thermoactinomyces sp. CICC 10523]MBH8603315.1 HAD family hydrolase [Thermoactinomyces sp. CICC 10522]MBH8607917.1 HAD family hydrolase [Thermoactinomyces sp. CICC 10521]